MQFDFEKIGAENAYKLVVASVVPRPVAWVVTQDEKGVVNAAPYSFFNAFSSDPVVVGIGCGPRPEGAAKDTLANIRAIGEFVVNLVPARLAEAMNVTAVEFDAGRDELAEAGLATAPSAKVRVPRIAESPVALECVTYQLIPAGRHTIVLGRVVALHIADDCVLEAEAGRKADELWLHSDCGGVDAVCEFAHHLLQRFQSKDIVTFEWSYDCTKPRSNAFGGGAAIITAAEIKSITTSDWIREQTQPAILKPST